MGEEELRSKGYPKTPDVKLKTPIIIKEHVVYWIDSKASFGDDYNYSVNYKEQFSGYISRYGPGLVIYWFGFIQELNGENDDVLLLCDFPENVVRLAIKE
eukprot:TRINITY_DN569_c1_g1_i1.p1 TRINITY_DN569_c1_g1~~TRINITY_DN569_c1_g1_i1.p1  ORF type:complete len:100 (+),score=15.86 TRINITY_DN569_c1_g1_i1:832-1131(+)